MSVTAISALCCCGAPVAHCAPILPNADYQFFGPGVSGTAQPVTAAMYWAAVADAFTIPATAWTIMFPGPLLGQTMTTGIAGYDPGNHLPNQAGSAVFARNAAIATIPLSVSFTATDVTTATLTFTVTDLDTSYGTPMVVSVAVNGTATGTINACDGTGGPYMLDIDPTLLNYSGDNIIDLTITLPAPYDWLFAGSNAWYQAGWVLGGGEQVCLTFAMKH